MRSSVSYILSSTTSEPNMSHPDYEQYSHDHAALLVLIRHIGSQLKNKTFSKFYERISRVNNVKITDSTGQVRNILVRYVKDHPIENNDWGDFQTHRRLLGLISLGKYDSQLELNEICRVHESLKVKYTNTLFDSRCILFGPGEEMTCSHEKIASDLGDKREDVVTGAKGMEIMFCLFYPAVTSNKTVEILKKRRCFFLHNIFVQNCSK